MQESRGATLLRTIWPGVMSAICLAGCGQLRQSTVIKNCPPKATPEVAGSVSSQRHSRTDGQIQQTARTPTAKEQETLQRLEHRITMTVEAGKGVEAATAFSNEASSSGATSSIQGTTVPAQSDSQIDVPTGAKPAFVPTDITDAKRNLAKVKEIVDRATKFYEDNPKFTCRITRKERVGGKVLPQETMAMNFRLHPRSVYYKWLDSDNQGREMVYVDGKNDGKIITLGGRSDFLMTGKRIKVDPTGFLAKKNGRYPISDSGNDKMMQRLTSQIANQERGDYSHGVLRYIGKVNREENFGPMDYIVHEIPKGFDHAFPDGGVRHWYFDEKTSRMVLLHAEDPKGEFLEYYLFDRFLPNPALEDRDFDPDYLWPKKTAGTDPETPPSRLAAKDERPPK